MAKQKTTYECSQCNYKSIKWLGCCPSCNEWDSFSELAPVMPFIGKSGLQPRSGSHVQMAQLNAVSSKQRERMLTGMDEWDRVMGGGIMRGSLLVLTGDPGIGKSTLLLQVSNKLAHAHSVYYFSTEESLHQVKLRAERIGAINDMLLFSDHADLESIITTAREAKPDVVIIDSIQNCYLQGAHTLPGSVGQLRESTFQLMRLAKEHDITVVITGHITKEGVIAGPKTLEHMVDAVFYLQGEDRWHTRVLRAVKNRFGTINEIGFFEMQQSGLQEVPNINEHLLSEASHTPGSALVSVMEGSRLLLLELQALTIETKMTMPQRVISGIDHKQVVLIAAILQKYLHVKLNIHDIFFKISGGIKVKESSIDLGIALALLSSYFQQPLPEHAIALGEISLTGHIKPINQMSTFIREAEKFGIKRLLVAKNQKLDNTSCSATRLQNVYELLSLFDV